MDAYDLKIEMIGTVEHCLSGAVGWEFINDGGPGSSSAVDRLVVSVEKCVGSGHAQRQRNRLNRVNSTSSSWMETDIHVPCKKKIPHNDCGTALVAAV
jgi:hypothetical protein